VNCAISIAQGRGLTVTPGGRGGAPV